jgi:hypothetical protein
MAKTCSYVGLKIKHLTCIDSYNLPKTAPGQKTLKVVVLRCDCGNEIEALSNNWKYKESPSDCRKSDCPYSPVVGDVSKDNLYGRWLQIKSRCSDIKNHSYKNYGAKGVWVCQEWKDSFKLFSAWAYANGFEKHLQLDRIDNDKGYHPENCRWVTQQENLRNKKEYKTLTIDGETKKLFDWADKFKVPYHQIHDLTKVKGGKSVDSRIEAFKAKCVP